MTGACTSWATERRPRLAAFLLVALAIGAAPSPAAMGASAVGPGDLRDIIGKANKFIRKAEGALSGRDPGRVSALLRAADEQIVLFQEASRATELVDALKKARVAATTGDLAAAAAAVAQARVMLPGLGDYVVPRQAEVSGRLALSAAEAGNGPACLEALDDLESAILAPVLGARLREAREAVEQGRKAMVRRDMAAGKDAVATARRALDGLQYAGALSRALYTLRISTELMEQGAIMAAREQVRVGLQSIRLAADLAPASQRTALEQAHADVYGIWKRMNKAREGDTARILEVARTVETVRGKQS